MSNVAGGRDKRRDGSNAAGLVITDLVAGYGGSPAVFGFDLSVARSEFVTLLGPSGCGKTTTLRCVAGLHTPDSGEIHLGGTCVHSNAVRVPAHKRDINMVFQSYAIWPHMTTVKNVTYGLKAHRVPRTRALAKAREMLELVGLSAYEDRNATDLSGGQQQRVALARALATEPGLVLMDEPLSNLDARLRARMRNEIRQIQRSTGATVLYVTHDQAEALSMSDRIVVMNEGRIQQIGDPWTLYNRPNNEFVATFLGEANIVRGRAVAIDGSSCDVEIEEIPDTTLRVTLRPEDERVVAGDSVAVVFRPEWVLPPEPSRADQPAAVNRIRATLVATEFLGDHYECLYRAGGYRIRTQLTTSPTMRVPEVGDEHVLPVEPDNLAWFHRRTADETSGATGPTVPSRPAPAPVAGTGPVAHGARL